MKSHGTIRIRPKMNKVPIFSNKRARLSRNIGHLFIGCLTVKPKPAAFCFILNSRIHGKIVNAFGDLFVKLHIRISFLGWLDGNCVNSFG